MTITTTTATTTTITATTGGDVDPGLGLAAVDLYRDIHKGIRAELFAIVSTAGSIDPAERCDRVALADHVAAVAHVLDLHAEHEDTHLDPVLREHLPHLAESIVADHHDLEGRFAHAVALTRELIDAPPADQRRLAHVAYLELSAFTSRYLQHQIVEERDVMPALDRILGPAGCGALHGAIVGAIPPDELARSLAFMLPAMNVDDRTEMLGGIRMAAPPAAFDAVVGLARSVLEARDFTQLATRLAR